MTELLNNLLFIFQRLNWLSVVDILMVAAIFFGLMYWLRDTQAMVLLRGVILIVVGLILVTSLVDLPAFSWLVRNSVPAMLLAIPVIFAPEIRRVSSGSAGPGPLSPNSMPPARPRSNRRYMLWSQQQPGFLQGSTAH